MGQMLEFVMACLPWVILLATYASIGASFGAIVDNWCRYHSQLPEDLRDRLWIAVLLSWPVLVPILVCYVGFRGIHPQTREIKAAEARELERERHLRAKRDEAKEEFYELSIQTATTLRTALATNQDLTPEELATIQRLQRLVPVYQQITSGT